MMEMLRELTQLKQSYFHLIVGDRSELQQNFSAYESVKDGSTVVKQVEGSKCTTLDELFTEFANAFEFPDYFGSNWAAFDECLNDLDWLPGESYLLLISDIDQVNKTSDNIFKTFVETLERSVSEWTEGRNYDGYPTPPTPFHVVFQCSNEKKNEVIKRFEMAGLRNINELSITEQ